MEMALTMNDAEMAEEIEWFDAARKAGILKPEVSKAFDEMDAADLDAAAETLLRTK
jgi:hypothetical protein